MKDQNEKIILETPAAQIIIAEQVSSLINALAQISLLPQGDYGQRLIKSASLKMIQSHLGAIAKELENMK